MFSKARDAELAWIDGIIDETDTTEKMDKDMYEEEEDDDIKMKSKSSDWFELLDFWNP